MVRQTGLGRGLGALIPGDAATQGTTASGVAYRELPVGAIIENRYQPREVFDEAALSALTASVREVGVLQPVLVRARGVDQFELVAGERRWRAAKRAGLRTIPAIVREVEDLTSLEHALVENLHRQDLGPLEEAAAYQQLIEDFSLTQEAVAQRVGKSRSTITNSLRLLQLPPGVQSHLVAGTLTAGHARALLSLPSRQAQEELAARVVEEELSVRQIEQLVREGFGVGTSPSPAPSPTPPTRRVDDRPAAVLEVEQQLADRLDTRVSISLGETKSRVIIEFADLEDLGRIYRLLESHASPDPEPQPSYRTY